MDRINDVSIQVKQNLKKWFGTMMDKKVLSKIWRILNAVLALFFLCIIADAWIEILYFKRAEKHFYYLATLLFIPFLTCLIVVLNWDLDTLKG